MEENEKNPLFFMSCSWIKIIQENVNLYLSELKK